MSHSTADKQQLSSRSMQHAIANPLAKTEQYLQFTPVAG